MATRREVLGAFGAVSAAPLVRAAAPARVPHVGFLSSGSLDDREAFLEAFKDGLRELGYVDGRNIVIDVRWAGDMPRKFPALATSLVNDRVDAIVATCVPSTRAAKAATGTIPIVMSIDQDPVAEGLISSMARPGANVTGTATLIEDLIGKWLELLSAALPGARRFGVLGNPDALTHQYFWVRFEAAARRLGVAVVKIEANSPATIESAYVEMARQRIAGHVVMTDSMFVTQMPAIVAQADRFRLPALHGFHEFSRAGGLMSYGISYREYYQGVARYVDAVLKGGKPGEMAVAQPTRIGLVVNQRTARAFNLTLPREFLLRAEAVI